MSTFIFIPSSMRSAAGELRHGLKSDLGSLPKQTFVRMWCALAYLFPGLHPDDFDESECDWPRVLKPFAAEAWRRADMGELSNGELYPSDAQWAGIFDRMTEPGEEAIARRLEIASSYGIR